MGGKRRRRMWQGMVVVLCLMALSAALVRGVGYWRNEQRWTEAGEHWNTVARCLAGTDGLTSSDPAARIRGIELAIALRKPLPDDEHWPQRCQPKVTALLTVLRKLSGDPTADAMRGLLAQTRKPDELRRIANPLWALAANLPPMTAVEPVVEPPPPVVMPPRPPARKVSAFRDFGAREWSGPRRIRLARGRNFWGHADDDDTCCSFDRDLRSMFCGPGIPADRSERWVSRWRLVEDLERKEWPKAHPWFAIDRARKRIDYKVEPGVWVASDGTINLLVWATGTRVPLLFRVAPGETTAKAVRLPFPGRIPLPYARGHWLWWESTDDDTNSKSGLRLDARSDQPSRPQRMPHGVLDSLSGSFECDYRGALRTFDPLSGKVLIEHDGQFFVHDGPPHNLLPREKTDGPYDPSGAIRMTCTARGVRIGLASPTLLPRVVLDDEMGLSQRRSSIIVFDCDRDGCIRSAPATPLSPSFVIPLTTKVLVVQWSWRYGVQFSLAPLAELSNASIEMLLDESPAQVEVVHAQAAAVVVVGFDSETPGLGPWGGRESETGPSRRHQWRKLMAFRIDEDGSVTPVTQR
jgi:hypothetical protein